MLFTVMKDESLLCNDCLFEDGDSFDSMMFSETDVGMCDGCGVRAAQQGGILKRIALVIARSQQQGTRWAKAHDLHDTARVLSTESGPDTILRGLRLERGQIVLLPNAETGTYVKSVEQELSALLHEPVDLGSQKFNINMTVDMSRLSQQLQQQTVSMNRLQQQVATTTNHFILTNPKLTYKVTTP